MRVAADEELSASTLACMCFGLNPPQEEDKDLGFPMDDVTLPKLFSLFDPITEGHGTAIYFQSASDGGVPLIAPTPDGKSVQAGGKPLHDFLARYWMLPRDAAMPVEQDYGAPVRSNKIPFRVVLQGPLGYTEVDWEAHPWTRAFAGKSVAPSPPKVLQVIVPGRAEPVQVHVQFGHLPDDADAGIWLYRHKRMATVLPQVYRLDTADAGTLRHMTTSSHIIKAPRFFELLCHVYGCKPEEAPVGEAFLRKCTATEMQLIAGKNLITLASCHDLTWLEGKSGFKHDAVYEAVALAVRKASAEYARDNPWPAQYEAAMLADQRARMGATRRKANAAKRQAMAAAAAAAESEDSEESGGAPQTSASPPPQTPQTKTRQRRGPPLPQPPQQQQVSAAGRPVRMHGVKRTGALDPMAYGTEARAAKRAKKPASSTPKQSQVQKLQSELAAERAALAAASAIISSARAAHGDNKRALVASWPTLSHDVGKLAEFMRHYVSDMDVALAVPPHRSAPQE